MQVTEAAAAEGPTPAVWLGGGIVLVLAAAALVGTNDQGFETAATAAPAALSPEEDAARRKAEVQAWIKAWRARQAGGGASSAGAGLSPEEDAARRKEEAQRWIAAWRAKQQK